VKTGLVCQSRHIFEAPTGFPRTRLWSGRGARPLRLRARSSLRIFETAASLAGYFPKPTAVDPKRSLV
jgi:hypothetical protein